MKLYKRIENCQEKINKSGMEEYIITLHNEKIKMKETKKISKNIVELDECNNKINYFLDNLLFDRKEKIITLFYLLERYEIRLLSWYIDRHNRKMKYNTKTVKLIIKDYINKCRHMIDLINYQINFTMKLQKIQEIEKISDEINIIEKKEKQLLNRIKEAEKSL